MCIILADKAKSKASSWEHRALKLFRCLHGSYLNCTWAFAGSEPHCKRKCLLFYENINFATITQMHCPVLIWVEVFILKINNRSQYTSQVFVFLWATQEFAVEQSFLTHLVCICCGGGEVGGILLPGAGTLKGVLFFLIKGELGNFPKGNHVICMGKGFSLNLA